MALLGFYGVLLADLISCPCCQFSRGSGKGCAASGGAGFDTQVLSGLGKTRLDAWSWHGDSRRPGCAVTALLKVSARGCHSHRGDQLTPWNDEEEVQQLLFGHPQDSYSIHVEDMRQCAKTEHLQFKRGKKQGEGGAASVSAKYPLFIGNWEPGHVENILLRRRPCMASGPTSELAEDTCVSAVRVLAAWGRDPGAVEQSWCLNNPEWL